VAIVRLFGHGAGLALIFFSTAGAFAIFAGRQNRLNGFMSRGGLSPPPNYGVGGVRGPLPVLALCPAQGPDGDVDGT